MYVLRQVWVTLILIATIACPAECQVSSKTSINCMDTVLCPCCSVPCSSDGIGRCDGNCKDGYHGERCYNVCPDKCIRCVDAQHGSGIANCTLCRNGYFSTASLYQCQLNCSSNCTTCESSADNCTSCQDGYGVSESNQCVKCNETCVTCKSSADRCTSCLDGYYLSESHQCVKCNEACLMCKSSSSCISCKVGLYLDSFHEQCQHCNPLCNSCNSSDTCFCSNGCRTPGRPFGCQMETGLCNFGCRMNFTSINTSNTCDQCIDGNYGIECNLQCKATCEPAQCERISGNCLRCKAGLYGDKCGMNCPTNCQSTCDKSTGHCDSCKRGFYGNNCTLHCPTHCQVCTYTNGQCTTCVGGLYGENCEVTCPENCLERTCNQTNGHCFSCMIGFMGLNCEVSIITSSSTNRLGPPLVVPATPQNYVGAAVGITLAAVVIIAALVGVGLWCYRKRNCGISSGNRSLFSISSHMSDIEKVEKEMASIDSQLIKLNTQLIKLNTQLNKLNTQSNKLGSRRSELEAKLEALRSNIPYQNTNRADNVEDKSYEMLQRGKNESQYSTLQ